MFEQVGSEKRPYTTGSKPEKVFLLSLICRLLLDEMNTFYFTPTASATVIYCVRKVSRTTTASKNIIDIKLSDIQEGEAIVFSVYSEKVAISRIK